MANDLIKLSHKSLPLQCNPFTMMTIHKSLLFQSPSFMLEVKWLFHWKISSFFHCFNDVQAHNIQKKNGKWFIYFWFLSLFIKSLHKLFFFFWKMLFEKHRCIIIYWTVARRIIKANLLWVCSEKSLQFYVGTF